MKQKARVKEPTAQQLQQEQLHSLGSLLKQTRLQQGLSLETIEKRTLIRKMLLSALEQGNLADLPEPIYIRALLCRYSNALGLDGETVSSQFFTRPVVQPPRPSWKDSPAAQLRPLHLYAAYVLLIMGAVSALSGFLRNSTPNMTAKPILDPVAIEQLMPKQTAEPATQPVAKVVEPEVQQRPVEVALMLTGQSWVRVIADGTTEFEAILEQGETRSWAADKSITVRVGNAGGVMYSYNQSKAEPMGEMGMPEERTFGPKVSLAPVQ
ncbi:MAG: helix-turn-helix domain-containing protein [Phormidesmis sp. RL_2_1]|nr:helix-turn-helix domain-containing protein [Phormidesmis sp. RL_2_1]